MLEARWGPLSRYSCCPRPLGEGGLFHWGFAAAVFSLCGKRKSWEVLLDDANRTADFDPGLFPWVIVTGGRCYCDVVL